jgi:predicted xylose isomerase-like sugar epimerase
MPHPSVRFHTGEDISFGWQDSCRILSTEILEALLLESRLAVTSIEAELQRRNQQAHRTLKLDICCQRLQKTANEIKVRKRLCERGVAQATSLHDLLTVEQSDRSLKVYQEFLQDVAQQCGSATALLCHIGLGKHRVTNLKNEDRVNLLQILKDEHGSLSGDELKSLAESYHVPDQTGE